MRQPPRVLYDDFMRKFSYICANDNDGLYLKTLTDSTAFQDTNTECDRIIEIMNGAPQVD